MASDFFSPHARSQGGGGRGRGIRLPDAGEVSQVGIQTDPGVNVPDMGGIGRALSGVGSDLAQTTDVFAQAAARQQRQTDAIGTTESNLGVQKQIGEDWNEWQTTHDLADPNFYSDWNKNVTARHTAALDSLNGKVSENALTEYRLKLSEQALAWGDSAGRAHLGAMQDKSELLMDEQTNQITMSAQGDPGNLPTYLQLSDDSQTAFADTLPTNTEIKKRADARQSVIVGAFSGAMDKSDLRTARSIMNDDAYSKDITGPMRERMANQIDAEEKRLEAEAKQRANEAKMIYLAGYEDHLAYLRAGGVDDGRYSLGAATKFLGSEAGAKISAQVDRAAKFGTDVRAVATATQPELAAMLEDRSAGLNLLNQPLYMAASAPEGLLSPGNIDLTKRPQVPFDGGTATVHSISFEEGGQEILIPTVVGDKVVSNQEAIAHYHKTGEYLGKFDTADHATAYAKMLHEQQAAFYGPNASENFREKASSAADLARIIAQHNDALVKDPAATVLQSSRPITERRAAIDAAATVEDKKVATTAYAVAQEAEQTRLGLRSDQVKYLTDAEAESLSSRLQTGSGENGAQIARELGETWGTRAPAINSQLIAKGVPSAIKMIMLSSPSSAAAALLIEGSQDKELKNQFPSDVHKNITEKVRDNLTDMFKTTTGLPNGASTNTMMQENSEILTMQYMNKGDDIDMAAAKATGELANKSYTYAGTYRVPIRYDADIIARGARGALKRLISGREGEIDVPPSVTTPEMSAEDTRKHYIATLPDSGYWVTNPAAGDGLVYYDGTGSPLTLNNGKPRVFTWQELENMPTLGLNPATGETIETPPEIKGGSPTSDIGGGAGSDTILENVYGTDWMSKQRQEGLDAKKWLSNMTASDRERISRNYGKWGFLFQGNKRNVESQLYRLEQDDRNFAVKMLKLRQR